MLDQLPLLLGAELEGKSMIINENEVTMSKGDIWYGGDFDFEYIGQYRLIWINAIIPEFYRFRLNDRYIASVRDGFAVYVEGFTGYFVWAPQGIVVEYEENLGEYHFRIIVNLNTPGTYRVNPKLAISGCRKRTPKSLTSETDLLAEDPPTDSDECYIVSFPNPDPSEPS